MRAAGSEIRSQPSLLPRLQDHARRTGSPTGIAAERFPDRTQRRPQILYRDRPDLIRYSYRTIHSYRDPYGRLNQRIIWPRFYYPVRYSYGPYVGFRLVYPYYHRKYVFVSLGGFWPTSYSYLRYHWYGWHPYVWHGYYPMPRQVTTSTYNYYTYNYYTDQAGGYSDSAYYTSSTGSGALPYGIDAETYAKAQQRLAEQGDQQEPWSQTQVDTLFDAGVKDFEAGNYDVAVEQFAAAMELASDDMILPYAYAQALFATERYVEAAEVLRAALADVSISDDGGVFYPRGLYPDDETLFGQIEDLLDVVETYGFDADMQLLLGYNLLGVGETAYARGPLERAAQDARNAKAAKVLLDLVEKLDVATEAEGSAAEVQTNADRSAAVPSAATSETNAETPDVLDGAGAGARLDGAASQPEQDSNDAGQSSTPVDVNGMAPARPTEMTPATDPERLGVGSGVGASLEPYPLGVGPSAELRKADNSRVKAALIDRSATPAIVGLLGSAAFCFFRADKLLRRRAWG